jgi:hypothetical protein
MDNKNKTIYQIVKSESMKFGRDEIAKFWRQIIVMSEF